MNLDKKNILDKINEYKLLIRQANDEKDSKKVKDLLEESKQYVKELQLIIKEEELKVKKIIDNIKEEYNKDSNGLAETEFMEGWCYLFSIMLKKIFKDDAHIYICSSNDIHAITKIYDSFYDVRGKITSESNIDLSEYYEPTAEEFLYFIDICNIDRNKENIKSKEMRCDEIVKIILNEEYNESSNISQKIG